MSIHSYSEKIYLKEISRKKILSKEEQLSYSKKISELKKKIDKTKDKIKKKKIEEEIRTYRNILVESCYLIVVQIAKRYRNRYMTLFDLIEEGNLALLKAVDHFDYKKNIKFSTFASYVVKNRILTAIMDRGKITREPSKSFYSNQNFNPISKHFLGERPTPFQPFEKQIGVDSSLMHKAISNLNRRVYRISVKNVEQEYLDDKLLFQNEGQNAPEEVLFIKVLKENISKIEEILTSQEFKIISLYYGLNNTSPKNFNEIRKEIRLSTERIRQLNQKALTKIKNSELNLLLKDFL